MIYMKSHLKVSGFISFKLRIATNRCMFVYALSWILKIAFMEAIFSRICQPAKWNIFKKNSKMTDFPAKTDFCFGEVNSSKEAEPFRKLFSPRFQHWKMHVKIVTLYSIVTCLPSRPLVLVRAKKRKHRLLPLHFGNDKVNHESKNKCARA